MFRKYLILLLLLITLLSCSYFQKNKIESGIAIAKVNDTYLYKTDVVNFLPNNYKKSDSVLLVSNFIENWAKKQILLDKAKINLSTELEEINKLVDKYKQDLLINKFKKAVVSQNLDTIVNEVDIEEFYTKNKEMLVLNEALIKLKYIQISKDIIDKKNIIKLFKSNKKEDFEKLIANELAYKSYHFNDSVWIKYVDVLKILSILSNTKLKLLKKDTYLNKTDSLDIYLIKIKEVLTRNSTAPKSYVLPTIKQMILHSRKLKLIKEIEQTLLNDATKNGEYEIYK